MENLKTVSALVKNILEHDHKARNTDNHLYLMVLEHYSGLRIDAAFRGLKLSAEADRKCRQPTLTLLPVKP